MRAIIPIAVALLAASPTAGSAVERAAPRPAGDVPEPERLPAVDAVYPALPSADEAPSAPSAPAPPLELSITDRKSVV